MESGEGLRPLTKERTSPKDAKDVYLKLVDADQIPEKAEDFPDEVIISSEALGQM